MSDQPILLDVAEGIATITLNRPEVLNAIDTAMASGLHKAVEKAEACSARALLLKGAGRAFCAGGDISAFYQTNDHARVAGQTMAEFHPFILKLAHCRLPCVAAVHGVAAGAGIGLMLACDFVIAADGTRFNLAYGKIGASPDGGTSWFLSRALGTRRSKELAFLSENFDASDAEHFGLVNCAVPNDMLEREALSLARRLAEGPSAALAQTKRLIDSAWDRELAPHLEDERKTLIRLAAAHDFAEGIDAYREKRRPTFRGA
jgi:2-(1,2-epoxy-1,2-dihydrophenyl)acetyl-CoA isomerase